MQTQWAKANIRSETKDTPLRSQGGRLFPLSKEVILTGELFKPTSKLGAVLCSFVSCFVIKAVCRGRL